MRSTGYKYLTIVILLTVPFIFSCKPRPKPPAEKKLVSRPEEMDPKVQKLIEQAVKYAAAYEGKLDDSIRLYQPGLVDSFYRQFSFGPLWCKQEKWLPKADSLFSFIANARLYGLFPEDYHLDRLTAIRSRISNDTALEGDRKDAALWARADVMFTDAVARMFKDIRLGRLPADSITNRVDSIFNSDYFLEKFKAAASGNPFKFVVSSMEPRHEGYLKLRGILKSFLDSADFSLNDLVVFPNKNTDQLKASVKTRLLQLRYIDSSQLSMDSAALSAVIRRFQLDNGLTDDGKIGAQTVRMLNVTDREKFLRIAITLDRYKLLPDQLPEKYVWVNIPSYNLKLVENDSVRIRSRVVVGKPKTRTPVLNSTLYEMITYPQWTIPQSIIVKEILPALKKNPGYLAEHGYSLVRDTGVVDPYTVDWSQYTKGIPFRIIQGSGDDNALGVLKFNFGNKYAVYMHDTNQRYYFSRNSRALSHGCVRVQEWQKMAFYLLRNDSTIARQKRTNNYTPTDSVRKWLALKEKRIVPVRNRVPVFIRYFSCEATDEKIVFYEDIYGEDKMLAELYFAGK